MSPIIDPNFNNVNKIVKRKNPSNNTEDFKQSLKDAMCGICANNNTGTCDHKICLKRDSLN